MDKQIKMDKHTKTNLMIMTFPLLALGIFLAIGFGESFFLIAVPVLISLPFVISLSKRLSRKDAYAYPFVQFLYVPLLFVLISITHLGLELILLVPFIFVINTSLVLIYFNFAKNKRWFKNIVVVIITLAVTYFSFPPVFVAYPAITSGEFPFRIVYEQNGEYHVIEDTILVEFVGTGRGRRNWSLQFAYAPRRRMDIVSLRDEISPFRNIEARRIDVFFSAGSAQYFMGDRGGGPRISVSETIASPGGGAHTSSRNISKEQLENYFGVRIIEWDFPDPKNNSFSFFNPAP